MVARAKAPAVLLTPLLGRAPLTTEERLRDLERMRERINSYTDFMCRIASLQGSSTEAKDKAVADFHEWMATLERQLGRIHEQLRFG